ncbi:hypothetical protein MMC29_002299 [Sticta canariensis]|nr:hypothetical protein [Sticta canariensis]
MAESVAQARIGSDSKSALDAGTMAGIAIGSILFIVMLISSYLSTFENGEDIQQSRTSAVDSQATILTQYRYCRPEATQNGQAIKTK